MADFNETLGESIEKSNNTITDISGKNNIGNVTNVVNDIEYDKEFLIETELQEVENSNEYLKPYTGDKPYIFISYAHKDINEVYPIIAKLISDGFYVWYDDGIDPGSEWDENIAVHVEKCGYFIAFMSENYLASSHCKDELNYARDLDKDRFLVYLEDVALPSGMRMRLSRLQNIHKYKYNSFDDFYEKLLSAKEIDKYKEQNYCNLSSKKKSRKPFDFKAIEFSSLKVGDSVKFGKYKQSDTAFEDIKWNVLLKKEDRLLLISEKILDCQPYSFDEKKVNWQQCSLRRWLNSTFFLTAFSKSEQTLILKQKIKADLDDFGNVNDSDKVFILNKNQAQTYFRYDNDRLVKPTAYAISLGALGDCFKNYADWWLSCGYFCDGRYTYNNELGGEISHSATLSCYKGVRPCIWVRCEVFDDINYVLGSSIK